MLILSVVNLKIIGNILLQNALGFLISVKLYPVLKNSTFTFSSTWPLTGKMGWLSVCSGVNCNEQHGDTHV